MKFNKQVEVAVKGHVEKMTGVTVKFMRNTGTEGSCKFFWNMYCPWDQTHHQMQFVVTADEIAKHKNELVGYVMGRAYGLTTRYLKGRSTLH